MGDVRASGKCSAAKKYFRSESPTETAAETAR
jgi:hypothetical protein